MDRYEAAQRLRSRVGVWFRGSGAFLARFAADGTPLWTVPVLGDFRGASTADDSFALVDISSPTAGRM